MSTNQSLQKLAGAIENWMSKRPGRTPERLYQLSHVAETTIRYVLECSRQPRVATVLALCDVVMPVREKINYLCEFYPKIGELQKAAFDAERIGQQQDDKAKLRSFLGREVHNKIFNMAATHRGISYKEIDRLCGKMGLDAVDEMIKEDLLIESQGVVKYSSDNWEITSADDLLQQISMSTKHFDKGLLGTDGAGLMHLTGSIRKEKLADFAKHVKDFMINTSKLKDSEEFEGDDHVVFCDLVYSVYNSQGGDEL